MSELLTLLRSGMSRAVVAAADGSHALSGADLIDAAHRVTAALATRGIGRGDRVALHLPNAPAFASALLGTLGAGAAAVPCSPRAAEDELTARLALARPALLVTDEQLVATARAAAARVGAIDVVTALDGDGAPPARAIAAEQPAAIVFSSGSTGAPKGAVLTHGGLAMNLRQAAVALPLTSDDILLALAPFAHVMGLCGLLLRGLAAGATVVTLARFDPAALLTALSRWRVTQTIVPPTIVDLLAHSPAVERYDLSALRVLYVGGDAAPAQLEQRCARRLGCAVAQGFGMTEGGPMIAVNPINYEPVRHGSAGLPLPGVELRIVEPDSDEPLPPGVAGELRVASPALMSGYLDDPGATAAAFDDAGRLRTGDLATLDADGYLWINGRLKEIIKHNGHQIAPSEIEAVLRTHPAIVDAGVIGIPHARTGELPVAFVVAHGSLNHAELTDFAAQRLAPEQRLHGVRPIDAIPRTPSGKIRRLELRRRWLDSAP